MPLDFAVLAPLYNVENVNHPWIAVHKRMPTEPHILGLGNFLPDTKISIRAVGLERLVLMWRQLSGHCGEENVKADISLALWERRHWLQMSSTENAMLAFRKICDPQDPSLFFVLEFGPSSTEHETSGPVCFVFKLLWDMCTDDEGHPEHSTEFLLEPSHLQYSIEVLDWAPQTLDWARELRAQYHFQ
ncbi:LOW QUALITY PROTEIN: hypothetical protein PHMEG_00024179, partial [Phytophthora megakarya]